MNIKWVHITPIEDMCPPECLPGACPEDPVQGAALNPCEAWKERWKDVVG